MKRTLSIFLLAAILFSTVGITVAEHFCSVAQKCIEIKKCCKKCDDNCCKDEFKVYKLSYETIVSYSSDRFKQPTAEFISTFNVNIALEKNSYNIISRYFPPPLLLRHSLSFINVFLI